jgi:hypothetical protein
MRKGAWLGPAVVALLVAPLAQAKLVPTFSERSVGPGEPVGLDLGEGANQFMAPLKLYLVPLAAADVATTQSDPRLTKIGELGSSGRFDVPRTLRFVVPDVQPGQYTAAVWFKGTETGRWANALAGIGPRLTIRPAADLGPVEPSRVGAPAHSDGERMPGWLLLVGGAAATVAALVLWRRQRAAIAQRAGSSMDRSCF